VVGILVHGNNHLILSGPLPDQATALALVRRWSFVQIGNDSSPVSRAMADSHQGIRGKPAMGHSRAW
jgi:hypothetical protein